MCKCVYVSVYVRERELLIDREIPVVIIDLPL